MKKVIGESKAGTKTDITLFFTMVNGDKHIMHSQLDDCFDLEAGISRVCDLRFVHDITAENGVTKALVINMAQVSHIDVVVRDLEDTYTSVDPKGEKNG